MEKFLFDFNKKSSLEKLEIIDVISKETLLQSDTLDVPELSQLTYRLFQEDHQIVCKFQYFLQFLLSKLDSLPLMVDMIFCLLYTSDAADE